MYNKDNFTINLPSVEYLKNSKLINEIGIKCTDLSGDLTNYWTSDIFNENGREALSACATIYGQIVYRSVDSQNGVRPIITYNDLPNLVKNSKLKLVKNNIKVIEFGNWYSSKTVQIINPTDLEYTSKCYPIGEKRMGLEFEKSNQKYVLFNDKFHPIIPIEWYYDEENNQLLSVNSLFYSLRRSKKSNKENISYDLCEVLKAQILPIIIDSENNQQEESLEKQIEMILKQQRNLEKRIEKVKTKIKTL